LIRRPPFVRRSSFVVRRSWMGGYTRGMRTLASSAVIGCGLALGSLAGAQAPERPEPGPVFRLSVSLVQLDAVVTDRKGRHVTSLGPADFQVFLDGRPHPVTAVAYVRADEQFFDEQGVPVPRRPPGRPSDAERVIAFVVDDSRMSFESLARTRQALERVIDSQLQPDDLVSIVTTSGTRATKWPFTFSRPELRSAVRRLRFTFSDVTAASVLEPIDPFGYSRLDRFREETFATNAISRIADVIRAVRELPGRKAVVLVSEGFSMFGIGSDHGLLAYGIRQLVDRANRAGVVIYAIDPRGLVVTGLTAADSASGRQAASLMARRGFALRETQDGLRFIAGETGGFAVINNNDIPQAFRRIMDDQRGYYLIGFQPPVDLFNANGHRSFRKIKLKTTARHLRARTRAGFFGRPTE
jgi:VWFA-related protein